MTSKEIIAEARAISKSGTSWDERYLAYRALVPALCDALEAAEKRATESEQSFALAKVALKQSEVQREAAEKRATEAEAQVAFTHKARSLVGEEIEAEDFFDWFDGRLSLDDVFNEIEAAK